MNEEQRKDLKFYCWQLGINTEKELQEFKDKHGAETNEQLLNYLCSEYNKGDKE